ncbi:unnamed protein product [Oikopleura dioica]|uniref:Uncharacterized protein n=1 Tax=Oikopleura dioica TaxID=34765 RepID=E4XJK3_OIKDI|nr:unnamed protein product [Oikopleura dioica]
MERQTEGYDRSRTHSDALREGRLEVATMMEPAPSYQLAELMQSDLRAERCTDWARRDFLLLEAMTSALQLYPPSPNKTDAMLTDDDKLYRIAQPLKWSPVYASNINMKPMNRPGQFMVFQDQASMEAESSDYLRVGAPLFSIQREDEYNKIMKCHDTIDFGSSLMSRLRVRVGCYGKRYSWPFDKILRVELGILQLLESFNPTSSFFRSDLLAVHSECFKKYKAPDHLGFIPFKGIKDLSIDPPRIARLQDVIYRVSRFDRVFPLKADRDFARMMLGCSHDGLRDQHCLLTVGDFHHIGNQLLVLPRRERRAFVIELYVEGECVGSCLFSGSESKMQLLDEEIPFSEELFGIEIHDNALFSGTASSSLDYLIDYKKTIAHQPALEKELAKIRSNLEQMQRRQEVVTRLTNARSLIPTITRAEFNWACKYFHDRSPLEIIELYKEYPWISRHYASSKGLFDEVISYTTSTYFHMRMRREPGIYGLPRKMGIGQAACGTPLDELRSYYHRMSKAGLKATDNPGDRAWTVDPDSDHQPNFEHLGSGTSGLSPFEPSTVPSDIAMGLDQTLHGTSESPNLEAGSAASDESFDSVLSRETVHSNSACHVENLLADLPSEESIDSPAAEPDSTETQADHGFDYHSASLDLDYIMKLEQEDRLRRGIPEPANYSDDLFSNSFGFMSLGQITKMTRNLNLGYLRRMKEKINQSPEGPLIKHLENIGWPRQKIETILHFGLQKRPGGLGKTAEEQKLLVELSKLDIDIIQYEFPLDDNNGASHVHELPEAAELIFHGDKPQGEKRDHQRLIANMKPAPVEGDYLNLLDSTVVDLADAEVPVPRVRRRRARGYCKIPRNVIPVDHRTLRGTTAFGSLPSTMLTKADGTFSPSVGAYAIYSSPLHGQPDPEFHRKADRLEKYTKVNEDGERVIPKGTLETLLRDYCHPREPLSEERRDAMPTPLRVKAAGAATLKKSARVEVVTDEGKLQVKSKVVLKLTPYLMREPTTALESGGRPWCGAITSSDTHGSNSIEFFSELVGELSYQSRFWSYGNGTLERSLRATSPGRRFFNLAFSPGQLTEHRPSHIRRDHLPLKYGGRFACLLLCGARRRKTLEEGQMLGLTETSYLEKLARHNERPMVRDPRSDGHHMRNQPGYVRESITGEWYLARDESGKELWWEQIVWSGFGWFFRGLNFTAKKRPKKLVLAFGENIALSELHALFGLVSYFSQHNEKIRSLYEDYCEEMGIEPRALAVSTFRFPPALVSPRWATYECYLDGNQGSTWRDDLQTLINLVETGDTSLMPPYSSCFGRSNGKYFALIADAVYRLPGPDEEFIGRVDQNGNIVSLIDDLEESRETHWDYGFAISTERQTPLARGQLRHYSSVEGLEDSML